MIEVGRLCYKIAGREAGKPCLIVDVIDNKYVLVDGLVRRKKCNIAHLEFTPLIFKITKKASTADVQKALIDNHVISKVPEKGKKPEHKKSEKPVKHKIVKPKEEKPEKKAAEPAKKEEKKEAPKKAKAAPKKAEKKPAAKKAAKKEAPKKAKKK